MKKELFFEKVGNGTPIVMFHGNPGTNRDFEKLRKYIDMENYLTYALDRPGHGKSKELFGENAIAVYKEFIEKNCDGEIFLMGYSMGGYFALKLALELGKKVKGIILISPYLFPLEDKKPSAIPKIASIPVIGNILKLILPNLGKGSIKKHILDFTYPIVPDEKWMNDLMDEYLVADSLLAAVTDKNELISEPLKKEQLQKLSCPILAISGSIDKKNQGHIEELQKYLPQLEVDIIEKSGHAMIFTKPDIIGEKIKKIL